jgi:hypothetical protein
MISEKLKIIYQNIHNTTSFGKRAKMPPHLKKFLREVEPTTMADFGCGKGNLIQTLKQDYPEIHVYGYDPANPKFDKPIPQVDLLISTDVLEHVEPDLIDDTLKDLQPKSKFIYHLISCAPAKLILPDGRNAHLIQESPDWWRSKFENLGYKILKEDYREFSKFSKQLRKEIPVKNYFIMAVNERWVS